MCLVCSVHSTRSSGSHCTGTALQQPYDHTVYSQQCFLSKSSSMIYWPGEWKSRLSGWDQQLHSFPATALHELQQGGGIETATSLIRSLLTPSSRAGTTTTSLSSLFFVVFSGQTIYDAKLHSQKRMLEKMKKPHILFFCQSTVTVDRL